MLPTTIPLPGGQRIRIVPQRVRSVNGVGKSGTGNDHRERHSDHLLQGFRAAGEEAEIRHTLESLDTTTCAPE
ncbi:hypothetical protein [Mesorhizobium captivum]|uniref:hypothetical protein n=1 Tax=Mesorhizobium captivum TaxID=3072319 RepID=UPI002A2489DC|nr:hypothetical protein [Mesorhizobium sp. VK3C]MDX8450158.1 hypothetical protein [Mesorhizobium sp. VK3C]